MTELTLKERMDRIMRHEEADRVPITDSPWSGTIARWKREGMPENMHWSEYFGTDNFESINADTSPRFEHKIIEKNDRYYIETTSWGVTLKQFLKEDSTPEFLDFKVTAADEWAIAKSRMTIDRDRVNWKHLRENYPRWRKEGAWIGAGFWFGFDVAHSWMMGTETLLMLMIDDPELVKDIFNTYLDMCIAHFEMIWDEGYRFDWISWPDDLGYKGTTFFSVDMYRDLLKPIHKRAVDWAHERGIYAHLHSCGDVRTLIPEFIDIGVDSLNPLEVKAGVDPLKVKEEYGDKLTLHGGLNAVYWDNPEKVISEIERLVPVLKENGGYIFSSDHSIPNSVSLESFKQIIAAVKQYGKY